MSTRRFVDLASVAVSLFLVVGCAATSAEEIEGDETRTDDAEGASAMPVVETDTTDTLATGQTCSCPSGYEYQAGLCYPACASGYRGEGPVCWQTCASGFTDTGFFCHRNSSIVSANTSKCPWYNKCGLGSSCSKCPSGYSNDGCTCRRDAYIYAQPSYGRGAGSVPSCSTH